MAGEASSTPAVFLFDLCKSRDSIGNCGRLLVALEDIGIRPPSIKDEEEELLAYGGEEIPEALVTAIQASTITIVVLTGDYYDVSWGRWKVLERILEHFPRDPQRTIIPVYYEDRSAAHADLFNFYGSIEKRKKYRERAGKDVYKLSKILAQVDKLPGWDYHSGAKYIDLFEKKIARRVSNMLDHPASYVPIYSVGLESRLEELWRLLGLTSSSNRNFLIIGFYGMPGIGKSTLARAVYHSIAHLFEASCFLDNISENSRTHGLENVQKMLVSQISGNTGIQNVSEGVSMLKDELRQKDVLLILDDVDSLDQLEALGRGPGWFYSPGSRIIITTRNKDLLTYHGDDILLYEVPPLNPTDALELLRHKAFGDGDADPTYTEVLDRTKGYASGLPLVLDTIGSYMCGKSVDECEKALVRLERIPLDDIQTMQRVLLDIQSTKGAPTNIQSTQDAPTGILSAQDAPTDIQSAQDDPTPTSRSDPEGSQTPPYDPESQTPLDDPRGPLIPPDDLECPPTPPDDPEDPPNAQNAQRDCKEEVMLILFFIASSVGGLICNAYSPHYKSSIRGWTVFKLLPLVAFCLAIVAIVLYLCQYRKIHGLIKYCICYGIFLCISVYSYFYDRAVDEKPGILNLVSNAALALASLSLSKLFEAEFETGIFTYHLHCLTIQLLTIDWKLISVAIIFGGPFFGWHFYEGKEPFLLTVYNHFQKHRRLSGGRQVTAIHM